MALARSRHFNRTLHTRHRPSKPLPALPEPWAERPRPSASPSLSPVQPAPSAALRVALEPVSEPGSLRVLLAPASHPTRLRCFLVPEQMNGGSRLSDTEYSGLWNSLSTGMEEAHTCTRMVRGWRRRVEEDSGAKQRTSRRRCPTGTLLCLHSMPPAQQPSPLPAPLLRSASSSKCLETCERGDREGPYGCGCAGQLGPAGTWPRRRWRFAVSSS